MKTQNAADKRNSDDKPSSLKDDDSEQCESVESSSSNKNSDY
jgi:hypothetical protein